MAPAAKSGKQESKQKKGLLDDEQEQQDDELQLRVNESYAKRFEVGKFLHGRRDASGCVHLSHKVLQLLALCSTTRSVRSFTGCRPSTLRLPHV
jgi:hypothetical protein